MNNKRREFLRLAADMLEAAKRTVDKALDEEQDALDSLPENLECSELAGKMECAVDFLESASDSIDSAIEDLHLAIA